MGFSVTSRQIGHHWVVDVAVRMTRAETAKLFLAGDVLLSWPGQGLARQLLGPLSRIGMFVSEVASKTGGIRLDYLREEDARAAARDLSRQLEAAGLDSEPT
jgi:hypothetical protein